VAFHIAVANRKGGVGKSTVAVMLAHGLAIWGGKRVLVMDLDSQCNTSLILLGGDGWLEAKRNGTTIADYFFDQFDGENPKPRDFLKHGVGDVRTASGDPPSISLLPGSLLIEDVQGELYMKQSREAANPEAVVNQVRSKIGRLLRRFGASFDIVILDCPPGLSFAALSALNLAERVVVPFRPDYVSTSAVDLIANIIEEKSTADLLAEIPFRERRYVTLANYVGASPKDPVRIGDIAALHPMLTTQLPLKQGIADSLEFRDVPSRIEAKYGDGSTDVRRLVDEITTRCLPAAPVRLVKPLWKTGAA
jgi:chromosome partitioning protein